MARIVAGTFGGRRIAVPPAGTRPTTERLRESLFARLDHLGALDGARVLDLYAGSGALGLEALSRGATTVTLVESNRSAAAICRTNVGDLGVGAQVRVVAERVERFLAGASSPHDLVLVDPPYDLGLDVLELVPPWLADGGVVVLERAARTAAPNWPGGLVEFDRRRYSDTTVYLAERG